MALIQLIYMSTMVKDAPDVLHDILDTAVRVNRSRAITGMLLCADGNVMQVLEGEEEAVRKTFRAIQADPRHHDIFVLSEDEVPERQFSMWSMGFKQLSAADLQAHHFAAYVFKSRTDEIALRGRSGDALEMLKTFAQGLNVCHSV